MGYVLTSNGAAPGYYVARSYIGDYKARDYIAPVYREFDKRLSCSQALVFETMKKAREYLNGYFGLIPNTWIICEYDSCMNCITREV